MTAVSEAVRVAPPGNPLSRSVRDSMVVAKRNLIRMSRIPNPARSYRSGFISPRIRDDRANSLKEQVK
ncbi:integral membrane transport protein [Streptomyces fodineus]|uniref:Integral membrane transport protein n=1 Tax=Streptomyces fodineus TaxID=1904616 RepID=A0A1D7Y9V3_9ACTN|nr:integral membrane transport protein [Streptomyces fodineus]